MHDSFLRLCFDSLTATRLALSELGAHPHRKFGQNFWSIPPSSAVWFRRRTFTPQTRLEIGPGFGVLSELLAGVLADSIWWKWILSWQIACARALRNSANVHIITADFLELDIGSTFLNPQFE